MQFRADGDGSSHTELVRPVVGMRPACCVPFPSRFTSCPLQLELPATAAALERVGSAGVWVPPDEAIRQLLRLAKQGGLGAAEPPRVPFLAPCFADCSPKPCATAPGPCCRSQVYYTVRIRLFLQATTLWSRMACHT